jgi:hypothetical protein
MINKNTLTAYLESLKNDVITSSSSIHTLLEEAIDPIDEMIRENREKNKVTFFEPIAKEEIKNGIRYYAVDGINDPSRVSRIKFIDDTVNGRSQPSEWFEIDKDESGMFFIDDKNNKHFIGDIEIDQNLPKIPIQIPKTEPKQDTSTPSVEKKVKSFTQPLLDNYTTWVSIIAYENNDGTDNVPVNKNLGIIYTNSPSFPNRTFLDKIRFITNGVVSYSKKDDRTIILSKSKPSRKYFELSIQKSKITVNKDGLAKLIADEKNDFMTPDEFIDKLRDINFK